ncbi:LysR substrate-binding domain-containing protein [Gluconacetobacter tumulisoli]|uniref:LysR family transcriptional regulator n=1 Tax=Gluconacetobacter tumulisoli TaxID=1286189 RepID=A0A7W4PK04_9PROT|nr:LysR substrate-binding domain-containing protein [Gluconacetobacter tumulisoli]MBB2200485.1 LysR family transcriptional regulator [Gluconacetobacter tumulisoli]
MTLEQLRIFVAVAEREHVTRAAQALRLTQSAVSHAVTSLEQAFRVRLFSRVGRGIELTEAGRLFLDDARAVLAQAEGARLRLADLGALRGGVLHIHASQTIASYWLPSRLNIFHARYPAVEIRLTIANTVEVCRAVHQGLATIGLVEGEVGDPMLDSRTVARDQMVLVVAPHHPWVLKPPKRPAGLTRSTWILRESGSGTRSEFEAALRHLGVAPIELRVAMELPSNEAVRAAVESGDAATVLSASVVAGALEAGLLHRVPLDLPERRFALVWHRERAIGPSGEAFAALL